MLKLGCLDDLINRLTYLFPLDTLSHPFLHQLNLLTLLPIFQIVLHSLLENVGSNIGLLAGLFRDNQQTLLVLKPENVRQFQIFFLILISECSDFLFG